MLQLRCRCGRKGDRPTDRGWESRPAGLEESAAPTIIGEKRNGGGVERIMRRRTEARCGEAGSAASAMCAAPQKHAAGSILSSAQISRKQRVMDSTVYCLLSAAELKGP